MSYRSISYWFDSLAAEPEPRPQLQEKLINALGFGLSE